MSEQVINVVKQEEEYGCLVACIATILHKTYKEITKDFIHDFNKSGIVIDKVIDYILDKGFTAVKKEKAIYKESSKVDKFMLEPFADYHIVIIQQFYDDVKNTHAIIMDSLGNLHCPNGITDIQYFSINAVWGFYKDE